jgi:uncharacterized protein (UPF0335 family)
MRPSRSTHPTASFPGVNTARRVSRIAALTRRARTGNPDVSRRIEGAKLMLEKNPIATESVAADQLKALIERIERLEEEKAGIAGDIKEIYAEAKGTGFDTKAIRKIISLRKQDYSERQEQEAILELYMQALGMAA